MGGGVSSLSRLRKAVVIRAYNLRTLEETVDTQFRQYATRGTDGALHISIDAVKRCLKMDTKEYEWVNQLFQLMIGGEVCELVHCCEFYAAAINLLLMLYFLLVIHTGCNTFILRFY